MLRRLFFGVCAGAMLLCPAVASALDFSISWSPNTETDLAGYGIYWSNTPGGPYVKIGETIPSPSPKFTWTAPADAEGIYHFVVDAFDQSGNRSVFSKEASVFVDMRPPIAPNGVQIQVIIVVTP